MSLRFCSVSASILASEALNVCVVTSLSALLTRRDIAVVFSDGGLTRFQWRECGVVAFAPAVLTIFRIALMFCGGHFHRFPGRQLGMVARLGSRPTLGEVEFLSGNVHLPDLTLRQFGAITIADPVLAVGEGALVFRDRDFMGFGLGHFGLAAGAQTAVAVGDIALMIGHCRAVVSRALSFEWSQESRLFLQFEKFRCWSVRATSADCEGLYLERSQVSRPGLARSSRFAKSAD